MADVPGDPPQPKCSGTWRKPRRSEARKRRCGDSAARRQIAAERSKRYRKERNRVAAKKSLKFEPSNSQDVSSSDWEPQDLPTKAPLRGNSSDEEDSFAFATASMPRGRELDWKYYEMHGQQEDRAGRHPSPSRLPGDGPMPGTSGSAFKEDHGFPQEELSSDEEVLCIAQVEEEARSVSDRGSAYEEAAQGTPESRPVQSPLFSGFFSSSDSDANIWGTDSESPEEGEHGEPNKEPEKKADIVTRVQDFCAALRGKYSLSHAGVSEVYNFFVRDNAQEIADQQRSHGFPSVKTMQRRTEDGLPTTKIDYTFANEGGEKTTVKGVSAIPRELVKNRNSLLSVCAYNDLPELFTFYLKIHPGDHGFPSKELLVSSDGVDESKMGKRKAHIVSVCFEGCKQPIPWFVWEFAPKASPHLEDLLRPVVDQVTTHGFHIKLFIADGKEQHFVRGMVSTAGLWGCARCLTRGTTDIYRKTHFPFKLLHSSKRTTEDFRASFEEHPEWFLSENYVRTKELRQGLKTRSPLLDLQDFDLVDQVAIDAMHLLHEGLTEAMWGRIFDSKLPILKKKRRDEILEIWNTMFSTMKVPTEIRRKAGPINPAKMKASQWQSLDTFAFVPLVDSLQGPQDLQQVLLLYAFFVRLLYADNETFATVELRIPLQKTMNTFYKAYGKLFGDGALTFNPHSFLHCVDYRRRFGPVHEYSAARFEAMYSKAKQCYKAQNPNVPKQLLQTFHAYQRQHHHCKLQKSLRFSHQVTSKTDDSLIYHESQFFKIKEVKDHGLLVKRLKTFSLNTSKKLADVPWSLVGVKQYAGEAEEAPFWLQKTDVSAKAVICGNIISSCHPEWLIT